MKIFDLEKHSLREINQSLQTSEITEGKKIYEIRNPKGSHAVAVGLKAKINVNIHGSTGYYCGGMNQKAKIHVFGSVGPGVGENMMSGDIIIEGDASQYAGATGHGGVLLIKGNASSRCGISMKGNDIVVLGNIGHMAGFMAQSGNLVVLGNAGEGLGDSIYEANIFVRGKVSNLGADCIEKDMRKEHLVTLKRLLKKSNCSVKPQEFRRFGSARTLYNFEIDNVNLY
ncbi:MAG: protein GlxC [Paracoccaceae bacterium]|nr:protein GlxC [Paracoccaceae bacterium]